MKYDAAKTYLILKYGSLTNAGSIWIGREEGHEDYGIMEDFFKELVFKVDNAH